MLMMAARVLMDYTTDGAQEWLKGNSNLMEYESIAGDFFRTVGFAILKALHTLADSVEEGLTKAYDVLSFGLDDGVLGFLSTIEDSVLIPLLTISVVAVGILFIVGSEKVKASKVMQNLAVSLGVLILTPTLISTLNSLTMDYVDAMAGSDEYTVGGMLDEAGNNPMAVIDLAYVFSDGADGDTVTTRIDTTKIENDPWKINPTEKIRKKKDNGGYSLKADWDIFKWYDDGSGFFSECDYDGILKTGVGTTRPYRYHYSFWLGFFNLVTYIVVIVFTIVRCAQLAYSIVVKRLLATILAATDIANGEKLKFVIKNILYTYLTLMYAITALIIFKMAQAWITGNSDFNGALKVLMLIGIAFAVIDGPNVFKQVFGIDAGVKDGFGALDRTLLAARTVRGVAKDVGRAVTAPARIADAHKTHGDEGKMSKGQVEDYNKAKADNKKAHQDLANAQKKYDTASSPEEKARYQGEMDDAAGRIRSSQKDMDRINNSFGSPFGVGSRQNAPTTVAEQSAIPHIRQDSTGTPTRKGSEPSPSNLSEKKAASSPVQGAPSISTGAAQTPKAADQGTTGRLETGVSMPSEHSSAIQPSTIQPSTEQHAAGATTAVQSAEQAGTPVVHAAEATESLNAGQVQGTATVNTSSAPQQVSVPVTETPTAVSSAPASVQTSAHVQASAQVQATAHAETVSPARQVNPSTAAPVGQQQVVQNIQKVKNAPTQPQPTPVRPAASTKGKAEPKKKKNSK